MEIERAGIERGRGRTNFPELGDRARACEAGPGRLGGKALKAFLIAVVLLVVLALGAGALLNVEFAEASSDRYTAGDSVRLDPEMTSAPRENEDPGE